MSVALVALLGFLGLIVTAIGAPMLLARQLNNARREEKELDWAREDEVASKAAVVADTLIVSNERAARSAEQANGKLDVIHTLVNSNMTAAMEAQLVALQGQLVMMMRLAEIADPTVNEAAAIKAVQGQIAELTATLRDRLAATEHAEQQQQQQQQQQGGA